MNKTIIMKYIFIAVFLLTSLFGFSQMMAPQDPGNGPQSGDPPIGGGAPVGSGTIILLSLGIAYGGIKIFELKKVND
ncbi:MAG: hypothetical protein GXO86_05045 [Chlorobi bacterium]|nr:hypothetical protein [Chlorobiota bacterium]